MKEVLEAAGKSIWKEVRELALKKGTETLVAEGIKSVVEIVKRRRIRQDEYDFAEWKKTQKSDDEKEQDKEKDEKAAKSDESSEESSDEGESDSRDDAKTKPAPDEPADPEEPETGS